MESFTPAEKKSSWTDEFEFSHSIFEISSIPIRYYLTNIELSALDECFSLVEDIPGSMDWGYNAIFQRDIDYGRVNNELLENYLLNKNRYKFFSPLTIALLPYDHSSKEILDGYTYHDKPTRDGDWIVEEVGGVRTKTIEDTSVGKIEWDKDKIVGAAIDGQHRLLALMKFASDQRRPAGIDPTEVKVPITLLVFDPDSSNILSQVRQIFVDINKNAKQVSKARRILLDDRDPFAVFARDLVESEEEGQDGLRYEVVDWKKGSSKPEENQLTTIVALYEIVKSIYSEDLATLESKLDLNDSFERKGLQKINIASDNLDDLSEKQINESRRRFRNTHKKLILSLFRNINPYSAFVDKVSEYIDGEEPKNRAFKEYLFTPPNKRDEFVQQNIKQRKKLDPEIVIDSRLEDLESIKGDLFNSELLFTSIGQRGLFLNTGKIEKLYNSLEHYDLGSVGSEYADDINILIENDFFDRDKSVNGFPIWQRVCIIGGSISVSKASAKRVSSLILLAVAALRLDIVSQEEIDDLASTVSLRGDFGRTRRAYEKHIHERLLERQEMAISDEEDYEDEMDILDENIDDLSDEQSHKTVEDILQTISNWSNG